MVFGNHLYIFLLGSYDNITFLEFHKHRTHFFSYTIIFFIYLDTLNLLQHADNRYYYTSKYFLNAVDMSLFKNSLCAIYVFINL